MRDSLQHSISLIDIQNLSKPLLQPESTWSNHVTPTTLSIFDDGKSWSGIEGIESRKTNFNNAKQFQEASGQSWNVVKDIMCMESEGIIYSGATR